MIEFIKNQMIESGDEAAKVFITGDITEETVVELTKDIELCKKSGVKDITFIVNSPGGSVSDGMALYDIVVALSDIKTTAEIQGLCASAATYLPLACDTIRIHKNADMMLHEPEGGFYGTLKNAEADIEYFATLRDRIIALYASRTGLSPAEVENVLGEAKFLNAKECLNMKLVDEIIGDETQDEEEETKEEEVKEEEAKEEEKEEETETEEKTNKSFFSLDNFASFLKKNNISFLKREEDEFAEQTEVVNTLTDKVKNLETELEAKQKSYDEIVNRLEETTKDMEKKIQIAVANKIAQFGYSNDTLPAPTKNKKKLTDEEFRNAVKQIYVSKGYAAAAEFVNNYQQEI